MLAIWTPQIVSDFIFFNDGEFFNAEVIDGVSVELSVQHLKNKHKNDYVYYSPIICPITWTSSTAKKHCPIFLTQGLRCRDTEQKRCVFGLTKEPDQLHARSSDVIIRSSTNKFLSIWRGCVTDQALSPVNSGRTLITYSLSLIHI